MWMFYRDGVGCIYYRFINIGRKELSRVVSLFWAKPKRDPHLLNTLLLNWVIKRLNVG
tara:strand:+ start:382 stop:555 length:174 start_codon:yes stop_codon:yes gene_type:complete